MNKKEFLIKLLTIETNRQYPTIIKTVQTNKITEYLKLYKEIKEQDIPIDIEDSYVESFNGKEAFINDIRLIFGDNISFTVLEIYVDVL